MPLVGVITKAISAEDYERASHGDIPAGIGGGPTRGREGFPGDPRRATFIPPSRQYHERMAGRADIPEHALEREEAGRPPIAHPGGEQERERVEAEGGDVEQHDERQQRLLAAARRMGGGLGGALRRREGLKGTRNWFEDPSEPGSGRMQFGVPSHAPGSVAAQPHERLHTELGGDMNRPGSGIVPGEGEDVLDPISPRQVGVRGRNPLQQLRGGGNLQRPRNPFEIADEPEGAGHRRG
jgi:hypothetical protein